MFARLGRGKRETALLTLHPASCQASCPFFSASCGRPFPWVARSPAFLPSASLGCHLAPPSPFQHSGACISPRRVSNWKSTEKENSIKLIFLNLFIIFFYAHRKYKETKCSAGKTTAYADCVHIRKLTTKRHARRQDYTE